MPSVDAASLQLGASVERKRWETPVVIVASAQRETLSTVNSGGPDGTATTGSHYGS